MAIPLFFFFSAFAILNVYLPVFFSNMGYSSTTIGFLLSSFEIAGIFFTFILCRLPQKSGKYGLWLLLFSFLLIILPLPMLNLPFWGTFLCILLYAIPIKTAVPVSDSLVNIKLGDHSDKYGMVRVFGSLGFIVCSLLLQFFINPEALSQIQSSLIMIIPGVLMVSSLLLTPNLLKPVPVDDDSVEQKNTPISEQKKGFFKQFSPLFWLIIIVLTFGNFGQYGPYKFFSLYVKDFLHSDSYGYLWAFATICEVPTLFFSYLFVRKFGSKNLILFCVAMISVRNFVYVLFPSVGGAALGQFFHCFTFGILHPATVIFIAQEAKGKKQVTAQAISSVGSAGFASVCGSFLGGIVIDHLGYTQLYVIFGCVPLIGLALYFFLHKKVCK